MNSFEGFVSYKHKEGYYRKVIDERLSYVELCSASGYVVHWTVVECSMLKMLAFLNQWKLIFAIVITI